jgi:Rps23 Pro-64 3,4-dihydroxylase Tpa1-like proline 4-hydroxylase
MDSVVHTFFSNEECDEIAILCEKIGIKFNHNVSIYNKWDNRKIHNEEFKTRILKRYKEVYSNDTTLPFDLNSLTIDNIYLSITRYYDGRFLEMHKDTSSDLTTVVVLTDEFEDGRFVLSENKTLIQNNIIDKSLIHTIKKGNGLRFNGGEVYHGVLPVNKGIRKSLNIWIKPDIFKMNVNDKDFNVKTKKTFL